MTSVNDSNTNKEISITDEKIPSMDIAMKNQEEQTDAVSSGEVNTTINEEEKHDDVSSSSESEMKDDDTDAQPLFEQPVILDGKRSRRPTSRLEISELTPSKKELLIPQGHGKPLGEIEYSKQKKTDCLDIDRKTNLLFYLVNHQITHASTDSLSRLRTICFGRRGNKSTIRKNLREFKGFDFPRTGDEYQKHLNTLIKFRKDQLKSMSNILGLPATGRNDEHAERILHFLMKPIDEGRKVPAKKSTGRTPKKRTHSSKESPDAENETKKDNKERPDTEYVYKPGKKSSNKRASDDQTPTSAKRKKRTPAASESKENHETNTVVNEYKHSNEETVKVNETDSTDNKLIEKNDHNEAKADEIIQDAN